MPYLNLETKMQEKITEFVNDTFKNIFNIPFSIINGNLNEYKKNKLPNTGGIYFIYCESSFIFPVMTIHDLFFP